MKLHYALVSHSFFIFKFITIQAQLNPKYKLPYPDCCKEKLIKIPKNKKKKKKQKNPIPNSFAFYFLIPENFEKSSLEKTNQTIEKVEVKS